MTASAPSEAATAASSTVNVVVRVRPLCARERTLASPRCADVTGATTLSLDSAPEAKQYTFDAVAGEESTQESLFRAVGRPAAEACVQGYNGAVFVYGQTGSGKTYTMHGGGGGGGGADDEETRGLVPRTLEYVFALAERQARLDGGAFLVRVSFLEIYNEQIRDLLDDAGAPLNLREDIKRGVYAEGLRCEQVGSPAEALERLRVGTRNRTVGETTMNRESSRSHSVFTIEVETRTAAGTDGVVKVRRGRLHLVDLAGSERQKSTNATGSRLKEASSINKSLSALGNVIMSLADISAGKSRHVPFRDSRLTFLLKDSLGGNAKTTVIANISPASVNFGETLSTLQFAQRAKSIKTTAVINEDTAGSVEALQREIRRLREALAAGGGGGGGSANGGVGTTGLGLGDQGDGEGALADGGDATLAQRLRACESLLAQCDAANRAMRDGESAAAQRALLAETLAGKREKAVQSSRMVLRFREAEIARLRGKAHENADQGEDDVAREDSAEATHRANQAEAELARVALDCHRLTGELAARPPSAADAAAELASVRTLNEGLMAQVAALVADKHRLIDESAAAASSAGAHNTSVGDGEDADVSLNTSVSALRDQGTQEDFFFF
jgi:kinesin family protein 15